MTLPSVYDVSAPRLERPLEMLVLHVPKTGGTALKAAMRARFGDSLAQHYADRQCDLAGMDALIGHFPACEVEALPARQRVTVLRSPLERALSEYFHFRTAEPKSGELWRAVHAGLPFLDYVEISVARGYSRYYFADADMSAFRVISHRTLQRDWAGVMASLGLPPRERAAQVRAEVYPRYGQERDALLSDGAVMARTRDLLAKDRAFFERWAA